ncbi:hypothetical protein J2X73_004619 [Novosphingobium sp. 1748]|uniref:hypothetical protein n=1 Tax=Novosphingobium sp. 1748 TaxID=2817760 RepID=UPI00285808E2|nr:hypothetical protein [Novosphingobium sp. 1748]MDR6710214.1 hypothetical protein [Novosphingobium sp. 1748]
MSDIIMDLYADFAAACGDELVAAGYALPSGSDEEILRAYANVQHRRVPVRARTVHKASYTVPVELVDGERELLAAVAAGGDLRPYQSTRLESATFDDAMLNDFGVQHFHLGTGPHPNKPGFKERTGPLLFAMVKDADFYSIGIYTHDDWANIEVVDVIHKNWPDVISSSSPNPKGSSNTGGLKIIGLAQQYTSEDLVQLRKAGINVMTQRDDGTIHAAIGGGLTTNRKSARVSMQLNRIRTDCDNFEQKIREQLQKEILSGRIPKPVKVRLDRRDNGTFAVIEGSSGEFDLNGALSAPPI